VIAGPAHREALARLPSAIVCADPYLAFARLTQWWAAQAARPAAPGVHPSAVVHAQARVDPSATVGALAVIGAGAVVGAGAVIGSHAVLEDDAHVGARSHIGAGVFIGARCTLGERCIVHPGVVIGADGFGFAPHQGRWEKIEQLGAVRIGDDVEIGANTCIDRGALDDTVIGDGVKLDNLIQIGHNVRIGAGTAMAGCVGVAGSARIGARCTFGGGAIVLGHLEIVDEVHVSAATVVTRSILRPGQYSGVFPFDDNAAWEKNAATLRQLHSLRERLRALEKSLK
jgi:UDP-3-O-[3-hydroxymyristoyl] glucosamine N-acyltransferase